MCLLCVLVISVASTAAVFAVAVVALLVLSVVQCHCRSKNHWSRTRKKFGTRSFELVVARRQ